jgi:hypothetical protein
MDRKILVFDDSINVKVSEDGRVWYQDSLKHQYKNTRGYFVVKIKNRAIRVHRLVAEAFVANPNNDPFVNHIDGNKLNNNASNLEWCTQKQNVHHALRTGLHPNPETPVKAINKETGETMFFISQREAEENTPAFQANISKCLMGRRKSAGGFIWEYA